MVLESVILVFSELELSINSGSESMDLFGYVSGFLGSLSNNSASGS